MIKKTLLLLATTGLILAQPVGRSFAEDKASKLETVATFTDAMPTGVTIARDGRIFINYPRWGDDVPFTVAELIDGKAVAYPDAEINKADPANPAKSLISVQSVVVDPANRLWILDTAAPGFKPPLQGGAKLVAVDLATNKVIKTIVFWWERGRPLVEPGPKRRGFGSRLLKSSLSSTSGSVVVNFEPSGLCARILPKKASSLIWTPPSRCEAATSNLDFSSRGIPVTPDPTMPSKEHSRKECDRPLRCPQNSATWPDRHWICLQWPMSARLEDASSFARTLTRVITARLTPGLAILKNARLSAAPSAVLSISSIAVISRERGAADAPASSSPNKDVGLVPSTKAI